MTDLHEVWDAWKRLEPKLEASYAAHPLGQFPRTTLLERMSTVQRQFAALTDKAPRFLTWCACGQTHALSEDCPRCDITTSWQAPR